MPTEHVCAENSFRNTGIRLLYGPEVEEGWENWILEVAALATQIEVDGGMAESVGEVMHSSAFVIAFCPFCGMRLDAPIT